VTQSYEDLFERLGVRLESPGLQLALTHRSWAYENGGAPNNERLEFLGDSVLGIAITDALYHRHPDVPEGQLAKLRSAIVNARALANVARELRLGDYLLLGKGEETTGGRDKGSILADTTEAVLGAIYLEHGIEVASGVVLRLFESLLEQSAELGAGLDWKTSLQELTAEYGLGVPTYVISEEGPDHAKSFEAQVQLGDQLFGHGTGSNKKEAEQHAAATAYAELHAAHHVERDDHDSDDNGSDN
jgi:ribonuclease-3